MSERGLIVFQGPSGVGKGTVLGRFQHLTTELDTQYQ